MRPYFLWPTMRVTFTTMVLAIFALVTRPVFSCLRPRTAWRGSVFAAAADAFCVLAFFIGISFAQFPFAEHGLNARHLFARSAKLGQRFRLSRGQLETQAENLLAEFFLLRLKFRRIQIAKIVATLRH